MQVIVSNYTYGYSYGQYDAHGSDGPFPAWCADQRQWLYFGQQIDYTLVDGVDAWGAATSLALDQLMSFSSLTGSPVNEQESHSIQQCIWSILDGLPCALDYKGTPITQHVSQLYSADFQDLLVSHPVMEPDILVLLGAALLVGYTVNRIFYKV